MINSYKWRMVFKKTEGCKVFDIHPIKFSHVKSGTNCEALTTGVYSKNDDMWLLRPDHKDSCSFYGGFSESTLSRFSHLKHSKVTRRGHGNPGPTQLLSHPSLGTRCVWEKESLEDPSPSSWNLVSWVLRHCATEDGILALPCPMPMESLNMRKQLLFPLSVGLLVMQQSVCVLSCVWFFATSGTVAPLSVDFFQTRILEWVSISSSRESSLIGSWTCFLCLLHWQVDSLPLSHLGSPMQQQYL